MVESVAQRQFTVQEVELLGRVAGFELVGIDGDFQLGFSLDEEEAFRGLVCMRRTE